MKIYKQIKKCRICLSKNLKQIMNLSNQPPANTIKKKYELKETKIPLNLIFCNSCKTAQLKETVKPKYLFSKYVWVTGTSKIIQNYSEYFYKEVTKRYKGNNARVLEIASNDGTILNHFKKNKFNCLGVDPAKNLIKLATKKGINTIPNFFSFDLSQILKKKFGKQSIIIARNVIPHVENIHSVVKGISNILDKNDKAVSAIEFHNASTILKDLHYDSIYHEHVFFFSILTISKIFKKYGLYSFDIIKSPISGGSWVIFFSKNKLKKSKSLVNLERKEKLDQINNLKKWRDFSKKSKSHSHRLNNTIKIFNKKYNKKIIAYGASARSSTMLNFSKLNYKNIEFIVDKNKIKNNKYTPGTNIRIISLNNALSKIRKEKKILVLAWNFSNEIINDLRKKKYKGKFIVPLPRKIKLI